MASTTKLFEYDNKTYDVTVEDGVEIIKSPNKPGPGWVQVNDEIVQWAKEYQKQHVEWSAQAKEAIRILTADLADKNQK